MTPIVGVGAVVVRAGQALLVKRAHPPLAGQWSIPGGRVEFGETLEEAVRREIREETGLEIEVGPVLEVFDHVHREGGRVTSHYVVIDYLCACTGGVLCAGDDAADAAWVSADELTRYGVAAHAAAVVRRGLRLALQSPA